MPLADFKCASCGEVREVYFPTFAHMTKAAPTEKCEKCASPMKKLFPGPHSRTGEVSGYEKANKDHMTVGKAADMRLGSKWV